ncbi:cyclopropane-fatty-acyl-phospholipid synthase family protein [Neisseriaceae bacterium TC5R-5]|nr:cyclopropane-fatty-acyl-phospholipid synthase family protein [Neisseriaceae bacterium TC5R-5]
MAEKSPLLWQTPSSSTPDQPQSTTTLNSANSKVPAAARAFLLLLGRLRHGSLRLLTPQQQWLHFGQSNDTLQAELHLHDWQACQRILRSGGIGFAEAYRDQQLDCPDLSALLQLALQNEGQLGSGLLGRSASALWHRLQHWLRRNNRYGSQRNIHAHYDLGNHFYQLWLDKSWTYSSAWFNGQHQQTLEQAQAAKYQRICEVLQLRPGMRVLEIGCGWGGFAEHAAAQGIAVHGITLSTAQLEHAQQRLAQQALVELEYSDYRDLYQQYDAIVSIEMFEAVGERYWPDYFATLQRCLKPGARALIQTITIEHQRFLRYRRRSDFIQQFIFPGGMLPSPQRFQQQAQQQGFAITDQLEFGRDYAATLRHWRARFEQQLSAVRAQGFDEVFIRLWRLYFCYCEAGFEHGSIGVSQLLLSRQEPTPHAV